jgi:hypothetical protein
MNAKLEARGDAIRDFITDPPRDRKTGVSPRAIAAKSPPFRPIWCSTPA